MTTIRQKRYLGEFTYLYVYHSFKHYRVKSFVGFLKVFIEKILKIDGNRNMVSVPFYSHILKSLPMLMLIIKLTSASGKCSKQKVAS